MGNTIATNIIDQYITNKIEAASAIINSSSVKSGCTNRINLGGGSEASERAFEACMAASQEHGWPTEPCQKLLAGCVVEGDLHIDQQCTVELNAETIQTASVKLNAEATISVDAKQLAEAVAQNFSLNPGDTVTCNIYKACLNLVTCLNSSICSVCIAEFDAVNEVNCSGGHYKGNIFINQTATSKILHKCIQNSQSVLSAKADLVVKISQEARSHIEDTGTAMLMAIALILAILFIGAPLAKGAAGGKKKGGKEGTATGKKPMSPIFKKLVLIIATGFLALLIADCQWLHMKCVPGIKWYMTIAGIVIYVILLLIIMKK